jgi:hypothetical protein
MVTMTLADVETAVPLEIRSPQILSRAYNAIIHRAKRDLPSPVADMSNNFELRNRVQSGQPPRVAVAKGESSPESTQPLTPISGGDLEEEQVRERSMYEAQPKMSVINTGEPDSLYRGICTRIIG